MINLIDYLRTFSTRIEGWMSPEELRWLGHNAKGAAVEIGSHCGRSASAMINTTELTCVDVWDDSNTLAKFLTNRRLFPHACNYLQMSGVDAALRFADKSLDFCFIDALHDEASVTLDIATWLPKVKPGGLIAGHDFGRSYPGVAKAVRAQFDTRKLKVIQTIWAVEVPCG